jgi:iron(III) transport system permease protein
MKRPTFAQLLLVALLVAIYGGYVAYPLLETVRESLRVNGAYSLAHFLEILSPRNTSSAEAIVNSILVSVLSVLFSAVIGTLLAFVFTHCEFRLRRVLSRLAILPLALPPLVGVVAFLFVFGESGILPRIVHSLVEGAGGTLALDGFSAIVAIHTYSFHVYFLLFVSTALRRLDASQLEAAQVLGSTPWRTMRRVVLPELKPALLGASILTFMASMASFSAPLLFGGERRFMTLEIYNAKLNGEMSLAAAYAIVLMVISMLFFLVLLRLDPGRGTVYGKGVTRFGTVRLAPWVRNLLVGLAVLVLVLELLPIAAIVLISFAKEGSWTWHIIPQAYTGENYGKLLEDPTTVGPILNSLEMSTLAVLASVLVGVSTAYLLTHGTLRKVRLAGEVLATLPYAIPGTVIALGLILAFNKETVFGANTILVGTFWILPLAYFVRMFPFVVRSTTASLERLDDSLLEAGQTFGATPWRVFRTIVLPIIRPGIISGALLVMITALGEFVSSILLYSYSSRPISVEILAHMRMYNFGAAAAYSVFLLVLIMAFTLASRFFMKEGEQASGFSG